MFCAFIVILPVEKSIFTEAASWMPPQVRHQHVVYKHPYVVVPAEFIGDRVFTYFSAVQLNKAG